MAISRWVAAAAVIAAMGLTRGAFGAAMIINEYNCVSGTKYVGNPSATDTQFGASQNYDTFFGRVVGNGTNWIELVTTQDHLDIRNWRIDYSYMTDASNYGSGSIIFSNNSVYSDIRSGSLITITENGTALGGMDTDTAYDPAHDDWHFNVTSHDSSYITTTGSVTKLGVTTPVAFGEFSVNNDNWQGTLKDANGTVVFGPIGEAVPGWAGSGINSREVAKLEANPTPTTTASSPYNGGSTSTFGGPNGWNSTTNPQFQDFAPLRTVASVPMDLTVIGAKTSTTNGRVRISNAVVTWVGSTAAGAPIFNVRQPELASGLLVYGSGANLGSIVTLVGTLEKRVSCERDLNLISIESQTQGALPIPMSMAARAVGGDRPAGFQGAVNGSLSPNNVGLRVKIWGVVTGKGQDPVDGSYWATVDDGSGRDSGEPGLPGIKIVGAFDTSVLVPGATFVTVEGASTVQKRSETDIYPIVRVSSSADVKVQ